MFLPSSLIIGGRQFIGKHTRQNIIIYLQITCKTREGGGGPREFEQTAKGGPFYVLRMGNPRIRFPSFVFRIGFIANILCRHPSIGYVFALPIIKYARACHIDRLKSLTCINILCTHRLGTTVVLFVCIFNIIILCKYISAGERVAQILRLSVRVHTTRPDFPEHFSSPPLNILHFTLRHPPHNSPRSVDIGNPRSSIYFFLHRFDADDNNSISEYTNNSITRYNLTCVKLAPLL